ncbi:MAG: porin [Flavobacteriales bacterium]|nr:porin [Flavobacteriales bacterium]
MARSPRIPVLVLFLLALLPTRVMAQQEVDERALIEVQDGISIKKDSLFLLNLRFRMQNRLGFITEGGDDLDIAVVDARVRRLRLRFDGFVMSERIRYYIQLSFSKADQDLESGTVPQTIRDAMVYYHVNRRFYLGFGQSKLPGNRQRVISSGNLQLPDRSIANAAYTLDRDFGVFGYWTLPMGPQELQVKGAFTTGDGRGASPSGPGMAYTGRLEWLPLGRFTNSGDYSEGDQEFEPKPKLSVAGTYSFNDRAYRTGGQLGSELYGERDMSTFIVDMVMKYQGWALSSEYFDRRCDDPITTSADGMVRFVRAGTGVNTQLSKLFKSRYELVGRYSHVLPSAQLEGLAPTTEELLLGSSKYLNGHRIKLQTYGGYRWLDRNMDFDRSRNNWTLMFQVEFGI